MSTTTRRPPPSARVTRRSWNGPDVTVIVVGALTFFPALSLGPIVEHFLMREGRLFSALLVSSPVWS